MPKTAEQNVRYRFAVPEQDVSVHDWIQAQMNLSMSLRLLIKEDILRNGCTDMTCRVVEQLPKRGRPPMSEYRQEKRDVIPTMDFPSVSSDTPSGVGGKKDDTDVSFGHSMLRNTPKKKSAFDMGLLSDD